MGLAAISTSEAAGCCFPDDEASPGLTIKQRTSREKALEVFPPSYQTLGSFTAPLNFSFQHLVIRIYVFSRQYYSQNIIILFFKKLFLICSHQGYVQYMLFLKFVSKMK